MTGSPRKGIMIIIDGLGDRPSPALQGRTPLEAAHTPNMNALAMSGQWGLVSPVPEGQEPHTHVGVGMLFGVEGDDFGMIERGPVEAAGLGWTLSPGDVAARFNFAHLERTETGLSVMDRRAGRIDQGVDKLISALNDRRERFPVDIEFRRTEQHRGVLCLSGQKLSHRVTDTDPGNVPMPSNLLASQAQDDCGVAANTASIINQVSEIAYDILDAHAENERRRALGLKPGNGILIRGVGLIPDDISPPFGAQPNVAVVAGCSTVAGLSRLLGFNIVRDLRFTADVNTDMEAKIEAAIRAARDHEFVYVHVKAPDICAHDRDPVQKKNVLEKLDQALAPLLSEDVVIGICADHGTDSNTGWHIEEPVPALMRHGRELGNDSIVNFGESDCAQGPMGTLDGGMFLRKMRASMNA